MKEVPIIPIIDVKLWGEPIGALSWNPDFGYAEFGYYETFRNKGLDVSPLMMPVGKTKTPVSYPSHRDSRCFQGLPGLIADALPDKFGNQLIVEWFARQGKDEYAITPLDKLCYIGRRGMGALEFVPAVDVPGVDEATERPSGYRAAALA